MFGMNVLKKKIDRAVREYQKLDPDYRPAKKKSKKR